MFYDYRKKEDLLTLQRHLEAATEEQKADLCAFCLATGLMRALGIGLKLTCFISRLASRSDNGFRILAATFRDKKVGNALPDIWRQTMEHMVNGKDTSDSTSAGGFNRTELNLFIRAARFGGILDHADGIAD